MRQTVHTVSCVWLHTAVLSLEWRFSRGRFLTPALFGYDKVEVPDGFGGKKKTLMVNPQHEGWQRKVISAMQDIRWCGENLSHTALTLR